MNIIIVMALWNNMPLKAVKATRLVETGNDQVSLRLCFYEPVMAVAGCQHWGLSTADIC